MPKNHYDYIIIGNGLAGLQLALAMVDDSFFKNKQIALIDPSSKTENDKTWSFWEKEPGKWNDIVYKSWQKASIYSSKKQIQLELAPYSYKSIRAIDFYKKAKDILNQKSNIHFINERVILVLESDHTEVTTDFNSYKANHVFDSRIPEAYYQNKGKYTKIIQHFKGWVIKTDSDAFDAQEVTMMDYRLKDGDQTTFMYVLPFSSREALVEFTYFTKDREESETYDRFIKNYISEYLHIKEYQIIETEMGEIPMTNFPFEQYNTSALTKIGTGGGWVKGSTGYSFKHTEKKVHKIVSNLKSGKAASQGLFKSKYRFYDKVFLKVLEDENHKGEWIFEQFYSKNSTKTMFRFLDEDTSFFEEIKIMLSLFSWSFIRAFFKTI